MTPPTQENYPFDNVPEDQFPPELLMYLEKITLELANVVGSGKYTGEDFLNFLLNLHGKLAASVITELLSNEDVDDFIKQHTAHLADAIRTTLLVEEFGSDIFTSPPTPIPPKGSWS